ncbi:aspartate-semialdehyde dehydrogenase [Candidatus Woesearchaeota archaeon]|nr:aspartate-semialdehyde dehydrogenase [Candidatus Woesearchaeota archaeon]
MVKRIRIGIFGATGAVGQELLKVLFDRKFPIKNLKLYASEKSAGKKIKTSLGEIELENANTADYSELDIAFFAIGGGWPKENAPKAVKAGCAVIDNSSTFRYDKDVPLVVPQINANSIGKALLIANPNCTTAIAALPLFEIYKKYGLKKVIVSTYQATSGAGSEGMDELLSQTKNYLDGKKVENKVFAYPIPFNLIPQIDVFQDNAYTKEEMKVAWETRKIFGNEKLNISCTSVRIPTLRVHSESITLETEKKIKAADVRELLSDADGVVVKDDINKSVYPMPLTATNKYEVEVGRIRQSLVFGDYGIDFFVAGDQLLRGAALNAVEIAEYIVKQRFDKG